MWYLNLIAGIIGGIGSLMIISGIIMDFDYRNRPGGVFLSIYGVVVVLVACFFLVTSMILSYF